uniref:Uncharacterized protein n=1 Tax=Arundo donax TaxID=35708 RepID=A0A0A9FWS0_ARUDO
MQLWYRVRLTNIVVVLVRYCVDTLLILYVKYM